ncbi:MAG: hypothetical protein ABIH27_06065 [Candidatus Omnitrophota bacterium]
MKLSFLLLLLLAPIVLFVGILSLPRNILEKAPFYSKPLIINTIWLAKEIKEISTDKKGNKVYELILNQGERLKLERDKDEGLFSFQTEESEDKSFFVLTNRVATDKEIKKIMGIINNRFSNSYSRKEMEAKLIIPEGYKQDLGVKFNDVDYTLCVLFAIFCLLMYFPIIIAIIKHLRKS